MSDFSIYYEFFGLRGPDHERISVPLSVDIDWGLRRMIVAMEDVIDSTRHQLEDE